jgi:hypothetical protein
VLDLRERRRHAPGGFRRGHHAPDKFLDDLLRKILGDLLAYTCGFGASFAFSIGRELPLWEHLPNT